MEITDVRVLEHERVMPPGMGPPTARVNVVTIATDEGIDGHVFVTGPGVDVTPQLIGGAKQLLVGRDPLDIGAIWHDFRGRSRMFDPTVQGYVDIALWDIAGKAAGLPVHRLLGSARTEVPSYASSWVHAANATYVEEALAYRERGFVGYKLHPPTQRRRMPVGGPPGPVSIREDTDTCAAVRDAVGEEYCVMLDSAWAYSYKEALDVGFAIEALDYHWYEDPLGAEDLDGYVRLKQHLSIPIVATEITSGGLYALPTLDRRSGHRRAARRRRDQGRHHRDDEDRRARRGEPPALRGARRLQRDRQPRHRACRDGGAALLDVRGAGAPRARLVRPRSPVLRFGGTDHDRRQRLCARSRATGLGIEPDWDLLGGA